MLALLVKKFRLFFANARHNASDGCALRPGQVRFDAPFGRGQRTLSR